jgi:hypothetical protein
VDFSLDLMIASVIFQCFCLKIYYNIFYYFLKFIFNITILNNLNIYIFFSKTRKPHNQTLTLKIILYKYIFKYSWESQKKPRRDVLRFYTPTDKDWNQCPSRKNDCYLDQSIEETMSFVRCRGYSERVAM